MKKMECFIVKNGVEVKAGLEDILPLFDDRLIQDIFRNAWKKFGLSSALAFMPDEIKDIAYRNLPLRFRGEIKKAVEYVESAHSKDYYYSKEARKKLISFIGENINTTFSNPDCLIWKESKPEEKPQVNPIEALIKEIENACSSKDLNLAYSNRIEKMSKEDLENALATFQDRKNELQNIRSLSITARLLPAAASLFENETLDSLSITSELTEEWPEFMVFCGNVKDITLDVYGALTEFPSWIRNAVSLRQLYISTCAKITYLPDWIQDLQPLTEITILNRDFKTLPDSIGNLTNLTKLNINWSSIEKLPDGIGNLSSLNEFFLSSKELTTLPDSIGNLSNLTQLNIEHTAIEKLPDSIGKLSSLKELKLASNEKLTSLPDSIGNLKNLAILNIQYSAIEKLPDSFGNLSSLKELWLFYNNKLTYLPDSIGNLKDLTDFFLSNSAVKVIPDSIGNLQNLTELSLDGSKIEKLPDSIGNLEKLAKLYLEHNKNLRSLPDSVGNLKNLAFLNLCGTGLLTLPDTLANCASLEYIDISDTAITSLPDFLTAIKTVILTTKLIPQKRGISYRSFCNHYYNLVIKIFQFSLKSRREGLLSLEEELEDLPEDIFKTGIRLVVNGTDEAVIREFFTLKIEREHDYYIKKLMEIAMEGILHIQNSYALPRIGIRLAAMVDIKNNPVESACVKYLSGDFDAFDKIDFNGVITAEGEREEITFIRRALEISETVRREGWLEIEKHLDNDGIAAKDIFEYGLSIMIENWDFEDVDKDLTLMISREPDPVRKNLAMAKKDALRMIHEGYSPYVLKLMLAAYFDNEVTKDFLVDTEEALH
jgi:Leucine-rich repeat (LRR) protein/flagellar motor component MotA